MKTYYEESGAFPKNLEEQTKNVPGIKGKVFTLTLDVDYIPTKDGLYDFEMCTCEGMRSYKTTLGMSIEDAIEVYGHLLTKEEINKLKSQIK